MEDIISIPYVSTEHVTTSTDHSFYISEALEDPHAYVKLLHTLRHASEDDSVTIYLNCPGGYVHIGMQIINAIQTSMATVTTVMDGDVCSMAAMIFLSANQVIINKYSTLMIHNYGGGFVGKGHEVIAQLESVGKSAVQLNELLKGFMTKAEIKKMVDGKDYYFDSDEVEQRLGKRSN